MYWKETRTFFHLRPDKMRWIKPSYHLGTYEEDLPVASVVPGTFISFFSESYVRTIGRKIIGFLDAESIRTLQLSLMSQHGEFEKCDQLLTERLKCLRGESYLEGHLCLQLDNIRPGSNFKCQFEYIVDKVNSGPMFTGDGIDYRTEDWWRVSSAPFRDSLYFKSEVRGVEKRVNFQTVERDTRGGLILQMIGV